MNLIKIRYNGQPISSLEEDQIAVLNCTGKRMRANVVIDFEMDGIIKYNNKETEVKKGNYAILTCRDKKALSAIQVESAIESVIAQESNWKTADDQIIMSADGLIFCVAEESELKES